MSFKMFIVQYMVKKSECKSNVVKYLLYVL